MHAFITVRAHLNHIYQKLLAIGLCFHQFHNCLTYIYTTKPAIMRQTPIAVLSVLLAHLSIAVAIPLANSVSPNLFARDNTAPSVQPVTATYNKALCDADLADGARYDDNTRMAIACNVCGRQEVCDQIASQQSAVLIAATAPQAPDIISSVPSSPQGQSQNSTGQPGMRRGIP